MLAAECTNAYPTDLVLTLLCDCTVVMLLGWHAAKLHPYQTTSTSHDVNIGVSSDHDLTLRPSVHAFLSDRV